MAIEAMKGAGMSYAGSSSASDVKAESQAKLHPTQQLLTIS